MGTFAEQAVEQFRAIRLPEEGVVHNDLLRGDGYWEERRQVIRGLVTDPQMSAEDVVERLLVTEAEMPKHYQRQRHLLAKKTAVLALLSDEELPDQERFQYLAEIGTGESSVRGYDRHLDALRHFLSPELRCSADGLFMRFDWTEPEAGSPERSFIGATPYKVDQTAPPFFRFEPGPGLSDPETKSPLLSEDSGLYYRYALDALAWLRNTRSVRDSEGFKVYGIYSAAEDRYAWLGGYAWATSEYPSRGATVLRGQEKINDFISRLFTYGGARLERIKENVGDFPGFSFVHDIQPTKDDRSDARDLAPLGVL